MHLKMTTYRKYITIEDPERVVLSGLPFHPGQRVEVVLTTEDEQLATQIQELHTPFKTFPVPQTQVMRKDEIVLLRERELEAAYQEATQEVDPAWELTVGDGLADEAW